MDTMNLGRDAKSGEPVTLAASELVTHGVVLGSTGSGKSGATVAMIEEAVLSGASAIVVDPKGDLTNLALRFPGLTPEELAPWVPRGKDAASEADRLKNDLGELAPNVARWKDAADVTIYAPGKLQGGGQPVNLLPSFDPPAATLTAPVVRERAASLVSSILGRVGQAGDSVGDPAEVYLTEVVLDAWRKGRKAGFEEWATALAQPPQFLHKIEGLGLEDFFPKKDRMKVARALVGFKKGAARWLEGEPLNIESFVGTTKPKVSVFTLRHLNEETDRQFFAAMIFAAIRDYMFRAPATDKLRLLVVLDEARGYLPPVQNPPTKKPLCALLAQGRAQGIGVIVGTQNPVDLDYKALSNVNTWFLGRLRERDCARDLETELATRHVEVSALTNIQPRHFVVLTRDGQARLTKIRCTYSYLRGPIGDDELAKLDPPKKIHRILPGGKEQVVQAPSAPVTAPVIRVAPVVPPPKENPWKTGDIAVPFTLTNGMSLPASVRLVVSFDGGGSFFTATTKTPTQGLATSPQGTQHVATWDSFKDTGERVVKASLRVDVDGQRGSWEHVFHIDNRRSGKTTERPTLLKRILFS